MGGTTVSVAVGSRVGVSGGGGGVLVLVSMGSACVGVLGEIGCGVSVLALLLASAVTSTVVAFVVDGCKLLLPQAAIIIT